MLCEGERRKPCVAVLLRTGRKLRPVYFFDLLDRQLKNKIIGEAFHIAFDYLNQRARFDIVWLCQVSIHHHLVTPCQMDAPLDAFRRHKRVIVRCHG